MKIYIANVSLESLNTEKLIDFCIDKKGNIIFELCSNDSVIYLIENSKIYKIENDGSENYELIKDYKGNDLLIDNSIYLKKEIKSQLPLSYILTKKIRYEFKINKQSKLSLFMEYILEEDDNKGELIDYYFIYEEEKLDLKNMFFQEEFNMFLFYLN